MEKKEDNKKGFFAWCGEKLLEPSFKGIPRLVWITSAVLFWGFTYEALFREKVGVLWFLYRYLPPPLNDVLLWEIVGPFLVGAGLFRLYNYLNGKVEAIKQEIELSPDSPEISEPVKRKAQITLGVGGALFVISIFLAGGSGDSSSAQPVWGRQPSPFTNIFFWVWLLWVIGGTLVLFSLALRVALGEMSWEELLKKMTEPERPEEQANTQSTQIFRSLKERFLRRLRRDKDRQD